MLDDRTVLRADHGGTGEFVWSPPSNRFGWTSYLGRAPVTDTAPEPCELVMVPGMYHGADGLPGLADSPTMITFSAAKVTALRPAIG
jgi:hypothetical protein